MNRPEKFVTGNHKPHIIKPHILAKDMYRYHLPVLGMKPQATDEVVMWTDGAIQTSGYEAGTNDGIRSGALSGRTDTSMNFARYCLLSDWLEAGNSI